MQTAYTASYFVQSSWQEYPSDATVVPVLAQTPRSHKQLRENRDRDVHGRGEGDPRRIVEDRAVRRP